MPQNSLLIVQQYPQPPERFEDFLRLLFERHQLDLFQSRQRLLGRSLAQLAQGARNELEQISASLAEAGHVHWLIDPVPPAFAPRRIYGLETCSSGVVFACRDEKVEFAQGTNVLAVLADVSGGLADKLMARMLAGNAYRGREAMQAEGPQQLFSMILQGQPVLDFYRLDKNKKITAAVRVFPGRFNPQGLGEAATLSSRKNLEALLTLMEEQSAAFQLHVDLGVALLPGCQLRRADKNDQDALRQNLNGMTRYGWLMADLWRHGSLPRQTGGNLHQSVGPGGLGTLLMAPLMASGEIDREATLGAHPLMDELRDEFTAATGDPDKAGSNNRQNFARRSTIPMLPAPPPNSPAAWTAQRTWTLILVAGGFIVFFLLLLADRSDLIDQIAYHSIASGAVPFVLAVLSFAYGFYHLRIKRKIENTPTSRIRSVAMGMVEVKGNARRKYALVAPMSHTPCVYYRLTRYRKDKNNRWQAISVASSDSACFFLEDGTGRIEINPAGGRVRAGTRQEGFPGQVGLTRFDSDQTEKWQEEIIVEGTPLYVLGFASNKPAEGESLREEVQKSLRDLKQDPSRLKQFDLDGDGKICVDEWDAARAQMEEEIYHQRLLQHSQQRRRQEDHIVIGRQPGRPLIIAETHCETHLTGKYRNTAIALLLLSTMLLGAAIYLLLDYLN
ncbi:hypothetical protein [Pelovirga terrestris]|uniref:EF-hand domain-containing protein n=1 Tax=Pelovirga terrestris TaxID=2771352 RepID=A0A8J6QMT5_9BACT|nr:hypothetical protein [Pelovirga terrestris]MBD1399863.1 hypothetical protein [Pelovirga terrestris]